jgi:nitrite reductase/ring-hydroxylating ferredoxin subunit/uncharacterized membrane protein
MLIPFPFAYLFGSAVVDAWARATNRRRLFRTAKHLNAMGLATALAAAVPGLVDYTFSVPPKSSARKRATNHMFANLAALALFAAARAGRDARNDDAAPGWWTVAAELAGAGMLSAGGWMGGTLVTRNQISIDHRYADAGKWSVDARLPEGAAADGAIDGGEADELKVDQMKLLRIGSRRIVLARTEQGFVAFDDRCTHKGGPLADGVLACGTVQCPWHGSQFDVRTGAVKHGPAEQRIATYAVEERDGRVWLHLPAGAAAAEHAEHADQSMSTASNAVRSSTLTAPSR